MWSGNPFVLYFSYQSLSVILFRMDALEIGAYEYYAKIHEANNILTDEELYCT